MSALTKSAFLAKYASAGAGNFPTNTTQEIGSDDMREFATDIADSLYSDTLRFLTVDVSSADILALFTTDKVLIGAQGANTLLDIVSIQISYDRGTLSYAGAGSSAIWVSYNTNGAQLHNTAIAVTSAVDTTMKLALDDQTEWAASVRINTPLILYADTSNPTTGDGTLKIYISYRVLTL